MIDDTLHAAQYLTGGNNVAVVFDDDTNAIIAYDTVYAGRHTFRLQSLYRDRRSGDWALGKAVTVPVDCRPALLSALQTYGEALSGVP